MITQLVVYEIILIAVDLNKQQAAGVDPKAIQQLNFTGNLN